MREGARTGGRRWHDWVIVLGIAALFAVGVSAIWGQSIQRWVQRAREGGGEGSGAGATAPGAIGGAAAGPRL